MSQERAIPSPSPMAWPLTAAMDGFWSRCSLTGTWRTDSKAWPSCPGDSAHVRSRCSQGMRSPGMGPSSPCSRFASSIRLTLAPEQKAGSRPVMTTARRSAETSSLSSSRPISAAISGPMAFLVGGSAMVITITPPFSSTSMNSLRSFPTVASARSGLGLCLQAVEELV